MRTGLSLAMLALAALLLLVAGVRHLSRQSTLDEVQHATGMPWPAGSEVLDVDWTFNFQSERSEVRVVVAPEARAAFLAAHPGLGPCPGDATPPAPPATTLCASGTWAGSAALVTWSASYTPTTGLLEEHVFSGW